MNAGPLVLAHRGFHRRAHENTLEAIEAAWRLGCDGAEFDVRRLRDGQHVLLHDPHVRRRGRRLALARLTLPEFRRTGARGQRAPTFEAVLEWARERPRFLLNVELKEGPLGSAELDLLDRRRGLPTVVTSFDLDLARAVKAARPGLRAGAISSDPPAGWPRRVREAGLDLAVVHRSVASRRFVHACRQEGLAVWAWGPRFLRVARRLEALGVEGFITNAPERLFPLRAGHARVLPDRGPS